MKHVLQAAALGLALICFDHARAGGVVKFGFDAPSEIEFSTTSPSARTTFDVDSGLNLALELHGAWENVDFGIGAEIQSWRTLSNHAAGGVQFQFIPIYLTMRLRPKLDNNFVPYIALQAGVAIFRADDTLTLNGSLDTRAGAHFGLGVGAILGKAFVLELMVSRETGSFERNGTTVVDVAYPRMSFNLGAYF